MVASMTEKDPDTPPQSTHPLMESSPQIEEPEAEFNPDVSCGYIDSCKPKFLQKCASPKAYLVVVSLFAIIQGFSVNGINNVNISTYERRYLLTSTSSGWVASIYDVAAGLSVVVVGYFGGMGHQPRWLGMALISQFLGNLILASAHFFSPPYEPGNIDAGLTCSAGLDGGDMCDAGADKSYLKNYLYVLLLGQALNGFAGTTIYSIGVTYLDESVSSKDAPLYVGIMAGMSILGPALGYILGGEFLKIYVDAPKPVPEGLESDSPSFVGAWWLGFVMSSLLSLILAFCMFCFPRELPDTARIRACKKSQAHDNGTEDRVNMANFGVSIKDMPRATWYILKNPSFVFLTGVIAVELMVAAGFATFLPKLISNQFSQSNSWSAMLTGFMAVPGAALGQFLGGLICNKWNLKFVGMVKLVLGASIVVTCVTPVFFTSCSSVKAAGINTDYNTTAALSVINLASTCNMNCSCTTSLYAPICADGIQYFNPCYAGCSHGSTLDENDDKNYAGCSCIPPADNSTTPLVAIAGLCDTNCDLLYSVFVPFAFVLFFFTFLMGTPLTIATLRVVPYKQRAFAIAIQWVFLRFLGSIPGPLLFGAIMDSSCDVWEDKCGVRGSCWIYNSFQMSLRLFILTLVIKIVSIIFNVLTFIVYKPPPEKPESVSITNLDDEKHINGNSKVAPTVNGADSSTSL